MTSRQMLFEAKQFPKRNKKYVGTIQSTVDVSWWGRVIPTIATCVWPWLGGQENHNLGEVSKVQWHIDTMTMSKGLWISIKRVHDCPWLPMATLW